MFELMRKITVIGFEINVWLNQLREMPKSKFEFQQNILYKETQQPLSTIPHYKNRSNVRLPTRQVVVREYAFKVYRQTSDEANPNICGPTITCVVVS